MHSAPHGSQIVDRKEGYSRGHAVGKQRGWDGPEFGGDLGPAESDCDPDWGRSTENRGLRMQVAVRNHAKAAVPKPIPFRLRPGCGCRRRAQRECGYLPVSMGLRKDRHGPGRSAGLSDLRRCRAVSSSGRPGVHSATEGKHAFGQPETADHSAPWNRLVGYAPRWYTHLVRRVLRQYFRLL